jgi:hypothetical protein
VRQSWADVSLAEAIMGYETSVSFEEGLGITIESYAPQPAAV